MSYQRVIPRDLFNESMLLKSLGRLKIHLMDTNLSQFVSMEVVDPCQGFDICQSESGDIMAMNIKVYDLSDKEEIYLYTGLNNKRNHCLEFLNFSQDISGYVLNEDGTIHDDFKEFLRIE